MIYQLEIVYLIILLKLKIKKQVKILYLNYLFFIENDTAKNLNNLFSKLDNENDDLNFMKNKTKNIITTNTKNKNLNFFNEESNDNLFQQPIKNTKKLNFLDDDEEEDPLSKIKKNSKTIKENKVKIFLF